MQLNFVKNNIVFVGVLVPRESILGDQINVDVSANSLTERNQLEVDLPLINQEMINILISLPPVLTRFGNLDFVMCRNLEKSTISQSASPLWKNERRYRLTASMFGEICKRQVLNEAFGKALISDKNIDHLEAVKHGRLHEKQVVDLYLQLKTNAHVYRPGLVVHPYAAHLGASPDGIVYEENSGYGVLEIKCPYSKKYSTLSGAIRTKNFCLKLDENNQYRLRTNHNYYYQIQGQMLITGAAWGDFVLYLTCSDELFVERIVFDAEFCTKMYQDLTERYLHYSNIFNT